MKRRRVVITGLGVVAPNGIGKDAFWANLVAGHSAVDYITAFDASSFPCKVAAEVKNFDPIKFISSRKAHTMGRFSQFAVAAAKLACEDAHLQITRESSEKINVCFGTTSNGAADIYEEGHLTFLNRGSEHIPTTTIVEYAAHAAASHVAIELGIKGQAFTLSAGCTTGLDVVQWGTAQIQSGKTHLVVAGASDALISPYIVGAFCALGILSKRNEAPKTISRPYDLSHDGMVLAEGAGAVILEDLDYALERHAEIYAEVLGSFSLSDSKDFRKLEISGITWAQTIRGALEDAKLGVDEIDAINAHGNSISQYDIAETNAAKYAFGKLAYHIPIHALKSMTGNALAASGIFQTISSCLTVKNSLLPPTINFDIADPECDLDYVPNKARPARVNRILLNSRGMGGNYTVLVLGRINN